MELLPSTPETVRRRKAMLLGLQTVLTREQSLLGLLLWERDFAGTPATFEGLHQFARSVCDRFAKVGRRVELHRQLIDALRKPDTDLPLDPTGDLRLLLKRVGKLGEGAGPLEALLAPEPAGAKKEGSVSPPVATLWRLLQSIEAGLRRQDGRAWIDATSYLIDTLAAMRLIAATEVELARWLRGLRDAPPNVFLSEEHAAALIHQLYVWTAETLGPVAADRIFTDAVNAADATPEGIAFSPRILL